MLYSTFTAYLGFAVNEDEYKVMGLAAYGRPTLADQVRQVIRRTPDGAFTLDLDYFEYHTTARRSYSSRFVDLFGPPRNPYEPIDLETAEGRRFADCAASVQRVLEDTLVDMARALRQETGLTDLCLGGGVALNGVANARILAESGFERLFVPPAPGDAGCALGGTPGGGGLARVRWGVFPVRPEWRERLAAVTHVDGTARLQALERDMAPRLYTLLEAYGRRTGIPVLLNTSFNLAGEPIVNRALEGYSTFRRCGIDTLVAGPTVVTKRASSSRRGQAGGRMIKNRG